MIYLLTWLYVCGFYMMYTQREFENLTLRDRLIFSFIWPFWVTLLFILYLIPFIRSKK